MSPVTCHLSHVTHILGLMLKLIHFADVHFGMENYGKFDPETGLNSRLGDFLRAMDGIINFAKEWGAHLAVFPGDAYKNRDPSPTYQRAFAEKIREFTKAGIPVVMTIGNHDMPNALGKANTLDIFHALEVEGVTVLREFDLTTIELDLPQPYNRLQCLGIPWVMRSQLLTKEEWTGKSMEEVNRTLSNRIGERARELLKKANPASPTIVVAHGTVEEAVFGSERSIMLGGDVVLPLGALADLRIAYAALGHIHKHQDVNRPHQPPVVYAGSIERIDFSEANDRKGFVAVEITKNEGKHQTARPFNSSYKFKDLDARLFTIVSPLIPALTEDPTPIVLTAIEKLKIQNKIKDAVVRVKVAVTSQQAAQLDERLVRQALEGASFIAGITREIQEAGRAKKTIDGYDDKWASLSSLNLLDAFLQTKQMSATQRRRLCALAQKLYEEEGLAT